MNLLFNLPLSKEDNLLKRFEEIHDYIYANDGLSPQQTLEEVVKILFIKIFDETANTGLFHITTTEWSDLSQGKTVEIFIERIANLFKQTQETYQDVFETDDRIRVSTLALGYTINKLQGISLTNSSQDAKGLAFQKFLTHHEKDGRGQFFTPEPVIDFCVEMMQPKPHETIIDPACGSGGFIMSALKYLEKNHQDIDYQAIVSKNIFGIDINKSIARIAKMKLLLEANGKTNIFCANSLEDLDSFKLAIAQKEGFDLLLANPPFGAKINRNYKIDKYFLLYFLKSEAFLKQMFMYRTGAAIPNVSDSDLANILIYLPNDEHLNYISNKVKRAFELRKASKLELESIEN